MADQQPIVLIVDDEPLGRDSLESLLFNQGYALEFAANGAEALAKAAQVIPDIILLDVMMPDMDGFEVCRRLRDDPVLADVPVVLVTALDDRDSRLAGIEAGADDFVTKPFDRAELRTRVSTITRLNRFRRMLAERSKFEWVVEQAEDGYLITDEAGKIHYANHKARLYLGLPANNETPVEETFHQLIRKQYNAEPQSAWAIWPDESNTKTPRYLVRPESEASQPFWLQVSTLQLNASANPLVTVPWLVQLRDVTDQMAAKTDRWNFHAMMLHKFRTPLIPMVTGLDLLNQYIDDMPREEIRQIVSRALLGADRLQNSIEDVLRFIYLSSEMRVEKDFRMDKFRSLITQICHELEMENVKILLDERLETPDIILNLAGNSIELILRELLQNTKKFHPNHKPAVTVSVSPSRFSPAIVLQVADDGITLSSEQLAQVWTPYYQGEKYFTGESAGMGLGLSVVASTVWNAGGSARIYNQTPGPGVVVELTIPIIHAKQPATA